MPSARRPETSNQSSDPTTFQSGAAAAPNGTNDSLKDFASETIPQTNVAPSAPFASVPVNNVAAPPTDSAFKLETATPLPTGSPIYRRRVLTPATRLRKRFARLLKTPFGVTGIADRRLATTALLASFIVGTAAGIFVMWIAGAQAPDPIVLSTTQTVAPSPQATLPGLNVFALPADGPLRADDLIESPMATPSATAPSATAPSTAVPSTAPSRPRPSTTTRPSRIVASTAGPSSIGNSPAREVGTSGRTNSESTKTVIRSRASAPPATSRSGAAAGPGSYKGSLAFRSAPQGARVFVNGAFVGSTPLVLENLPVGSRAVRIEADGYQRWSTSTQVVANQQTRVSATLGRVAR